MAKADPTGSPPTAFRTVKEILAWLEKRGTQRNRDGMRRYGIVSKQMFGVSVSALRDLGKQLGRDHRLAAELWRSGWYEARMLTAFVDEPRLVTAVQMDRWAGDFDNWAICDHLCFHLFDRTTHAWAKVASWSYRPEEFVRRAAFALLAALALHDRATGDKEFARTLRLVEKAAADDRNFVKKGVSWALRSIAHRNLVLHAAAQTMAESLTTSASSSARWVGRDTLRDITRPMVLARLRKRQQPAEARPAPSRERKHHRNGAANRLDR